MRNISIAILILFKCNLCYAQVTFDSTYDAGGAEGIFNISTNNDRYLMVANVYQTPYKFQIYFLDSLGEEIISKDYETPGGNSIVYIYSVLPTFDGNFAAGCFYQDLATGIRKVFIVKFNQLGDTLWSKVIPANNGFQYYGRYFTQTSDSGFLFTGAFVDTSLTNSEVFILKTDSAGNFLWMNYFGGNLTDDAFSSVETPDKGFLTLGWTRSFGFGNSNNRDIYLIKTDSLGNFQWQKTYGDINQQSGVGLTKTQDGNYLISTGWYDIINPISFGELIKIDVNGDVIWDKLYGGGDANGFWWAREQSNFDIVAVSAYTNSTGMDDGWIVRTDSSGIQKWERRYRFGISHCYFRDVQETPDGGIICAGFVFDGASGGQDGWLVKLDSTGCLGGGNCGEPTGLFEVTTATSYHITVSPNPVLTQAVISIEGLPLNLMDENYRLEVFDLTGKLVQSNKTGFLVADSWIQCVFKRENLNSGIYLVKISTYNDELLGMVKVVVQ